MSYQTGSEGKLARTLPETMKQFTLKMPSIPSKIAQTRIDSGNVFAFPGSQSSVSHAVPQLEQLEAFLHFRQTFVLWEELIPPQALPWGGCTCRQNRLKEANIVL